MRTTAIAAVLSGLAVASAATAVNADVRRAPRADYAQLRQAEPVVIRERQRVRYQQPAEAVAIRSCTNITCRGFILLGVGF
jgi:hypothetical protein